MGLQDITRAAVLAAITEYDQLGQDEFLVKYGFDRARSYLLIHNGRAYDSKAIVGVAHGFSAGIERSLPGISAAARRPSDGCSEDSASPSRGGPRIDGDILRGRGPYRTA